jgi:hypothetical protein
LLVGPFVRAKIGEKWGVHAINETPLAWGANSPLTENAPPPNWFKFAVASEQTVTNAARLSRRGVQRKLLQS